HGHAFVILTELRQPNLLNEIEHAIQLAGGSDRDAEERAMPRMGRHEARGIVSGAQLRDPQRPALAEHRAHQPLLGRWNQNVRGYVRFEAAPEEVAELASAVREQSDGGIAGTDDLSRCMAVTLDEPQRIALEAELASHFHEGSQPRVDCFQ